MEWECWEYKGFPIKSKWVPVSEQVKYEPYDRVIGVCFDSEGRVLVIKEPEGEWGLPGGSPEKDETPEETLIREVDEEATVTLKNLKLIGAVKHHMKGDPLKFGYEEVFHVTFFAMIDKIKEHTVDPAKGFKMERKFVEQKEFCEYVKWGEKTLHLFEDALKEFKLLLASRK